jgi:hypothetical protein
MLFAMYASFRWARGKNYVLKTAVLIFILSFFSAFSVLMYIFAIVLGPLPFLSFPFYANWDERRIILPQPFAYSERTNCYDIRFVASQVLQFVPKGPVSDGIGAIQVVSYRVVFLDVEIGAIDSQFLVITLLLFFIMVNTLGVLLGFLFSKLPVVEEIESGSKGFWGRIAFGIIILVSGIWLFIIVGQFVQASPPSRYYYDQGPNLYFSGAVVSVIFGISWIIAMIAENVLSRPEAGWRFSTLDMRKLL